MQIRTALAIGAGITIGVIFGMCVSEDTKCKIFGKVRKKLIHALGGEEKKNYTTFRNTTYDTHYKSYKSYYKNEKNEAEKLADIQFRDLLKFDNYESALECLEKMKEYARNYSVISVADLSNIRGESESINPKWHSYMWKENDLRDCNILLTGTGKKDVIIDLPPPKHFSKY